MEKECTKEVLRIRNVKGVYHLSCAEGGLFGLSQRPILPPLSRIANGIYEGDALANVAHDISA